MHPFAKLLCLISALVAVSVVTTRSGAAQQRPSILSSGATNPFAVASVSATALASERRRGLPIILVDVRSDAEYQVGHLPGALRFEAARSTTELKSLLRGKVRGATVLFYCTLGQKSQAVAERIAPTLYDAGARSIAVLEQGIIGWANAQARMVDRHGDTRFVHPADANLGTRLKQPELARYVPR